MNTLFRIAFGEYEFVLDRTALTYALTETTTGTAWASALSVGWIEVVERATGTLTRHDFGSCSLVSVAEKMSAAGKRLLLGLDVPGGIPVDLYFICGPKEIQLTVEASRDSKTHRMERIALLPGLCQGELILPHGEGVRLAPGTITAPRDFPVWELPHGLTMPFAGAVRERSALALLTDSAYATATVTPDNALTWLYDRDPEQRRLDLRIVPLPHGNPITIAHAYREKLIADRNHLTLRKKAREKPALEQALTSGLAALPTAIPLALDSAENRWEALDTAVQDLARPELVAVTAGDWAYVGADSVVLPNPQLGQPVPLFSAIYRDCVLGLLPGSPLAAVLRRLPYHPELPELAAHYAQSFPAFLTGHRFLTPDGMVEEALYSDRTRAVVNHSATTPFTDGTLSLPPGGSWIGPL